MRSGSRSRSQFLIKIGIAISILAIGVMPCAGDGGSIEGFCRAGKKSNGLWGVGAPSKKVERGKDTKFFNPISSLGYNQGFLDLATLLRVCHMGLGTRQTSALLIQSSSATRGLKLSDM